MAQQYLSSGLLLHVNLSAHTHEISAKRIKIQAEENQHYARVSSFSTSAAIYVDRLYSF